MKFFKRTSDKRESKETINNNHISFEIKDANPEMIRQLQNLLPYGVMPLPEPFDGAKFGIVMECDGNEVYCRRHKFMEMPLEMAEQLFQIQHLTIMQSYCRYIKKGFSGAYLATPYLRQRDNELWETGVAHFIFPPEDGRGKVEKKIDKMFDSFFKCFGEAFSKWELPKEFTYIGLGSRLRSHLQSVAMYFMAIDSDIICLRANLREQEDDAWNILKSTGIKTVYHLPSVPMTIEEPDLNIAKGLV